MAEHVDVVDELDRLVISGQRCEIIFLRDGGRSVVNGAVREIIESPSGTSIGMDSGLEINLTDLIMLNGKRPGNLC